MSADYFLITPNNYEIETFIERFPTNIKTYNLEGGRYNIQGITANGEMRSGWIALWNYRKNNFSSLEDAFTAEQMNSINQIKQPKFFVITAGNDAILNKIVSMIADDSNILICNDTDDPIIPGNKFVARLKP